MGWRDHWKVHPAADLFPLMSESELRELGEDIKANGLISPLIKCDGKLLDGRNRLEALELVGIVLRAPVSDFDGDPYDYVLSANLHRRHLTSEQKRELIAKVLKAKPGTSNAVIAKQTKTTDKTVAKVRRKLESTSEIPKLEKTTGADGKQRKSREKKKASQSDANRAEARCAAQWRAFTAQEASAEVSIEQRRAENEALDDDMPTEAEADESWQNDLYDQACLFLERMAHATRQRFFAHLLGDDTVEQCLSLIRAMNKDQLAQFFAKYTEWSAARLPARRTNASD